MKVTLGLVNGRKVEAVLEQVSGTRWIARLPESVTVGDIGSMTIDSYARETVELEWAGGHVMGGGRAEDTGERRYYDS